MRMTQKPRQVVHPIKQTLVWSPYPLTREEAFREDIFRYSPMTPCPIHGTPSVVYTLTGIPTCCAHDDAAVEYNNARMTGEPLSILDANTQGVDYYWGPRHHALCGHPGKITLDNKCWYCREEKKNAPLSPRQIAIQENRKTYMPAPDDPCKNGHVAERRVDNGRCSACDAANGKVEVVAINEMCPDMIISRSDARIMGFKVYRTGEACGKGHRGWRYVSTSGCLDCLKGLPTIQEG